MSCLQNFHSATNPPFALVRRTGRGQQQMAIFLHLLYRLHPCNSVRCFVDQTEARLATDIAQFKRLKAEG